VDFPEKPEDLTAEWLTYVLREQGVIKNACVQSFEAKPTGGVSGVLGEHVRLHLTYDITESDVPQTIYAKFSLSDPNLRSIPQQLGFYKNEASFYEQIATQVELRTPHCFYNALNEETGSCILLLEDLAPARNGEYTVGCSPEQAELAVQAIAKFHATWWESPQLDTLSWLSEYNAKEYQSIYDRASQPFFDKVGDRLPKSLLKLAIRSLKSVSIVDNSHFEAPQTMIHGDYHLENLFFATEQGGVPLAVVDWQTVHRGRGVMDVAYLLVKGLQPTDRKTYEMDILHSYHRILLENGVQGYSFDQCLLDYRLHTLRALYVFIGVIGLGLYQGDRLNSYCDALVPRMDAALTELNVGELLPK
jgi:aminoglycoside/choline kinase family phosphotransferase